MELYRPIGPTPLFVAPYAGVGSATFNLIEDDAVIARYRQNVSRVGLNVGVNLGARSDVRVGAYVGRTLGVDQGGRSRVSGVDAARRPAARCVWRLDTQDSPVVPAGGLLSEVRLSRIFNSPDIAVDGRERSTSTSSLTQLSAMAQSILERRSTQPGVPVRRARHVVRGRTVADRSVRARHAVQARRLQTRASSEGRHYYVATGGYLRQVGRLPDFMGGPIFAGGWLENGDAFDEWRDAPLANERRRRPGDGHARRTSHGRRLVGL